MFEYGFLWIILNEISFYEINKTALHLAVEKGNEEITQLLLANKKVNVNIETILIIELLISFQIFCF